MLCSYALWPPPIDFFLLHVLPYADDKISICASCCQWRQVLSAAPPLVTEYHQAKVAPVRSARQRGAASSCPSFHTLQQLLQSRARRTCEELRSVPCTAAGEWQARAGRAQEQLRPSQDGCAQLARSLVCQHHVCCVATGRHLPHCACMRCQCIAGCTRWARVGMGIALKAMLRARLCADGHRAASRRCSSRSSSRGEPQLV